MIDLTDVLQDEELGYTPLVCIRLAQTVSAQGRAVNTPTSIPFGGIVTQDAGAILERVEAGAYVTGSILVTSSFQFRTVGPGQDSDVVTWNGKNYSVNAIGDYNVHGVNWAVCNPDGLDNA